MDAVQQEFWGDLQIDLYTQNSAIYLANQSLETILSTNGRKLHRPILSHPQVGTYTAHTDISFERKTASDQYLEVDTHEYAAEDIDDTESSQTPYGLTDHSLMSIRKGLMNIVEQEFLSEVVNADQTISGAPIEVTSTNVLDIIEEAEGRLGAFVVPFETEMRALVLGPRTVAKLRRARGERETKMGDSVQSNGVVGPWNGWTVVQSNNLPWSASLGLATQPTAGDTITISGVTFEFQSTLSSAAAGNVAVKIGADAAATRANLSKCLADTGTVDTDYAQMTAKQSFIIRRKRRVAATTAASMAFTGFGDISVSSDLTDTTDGWSNQRQKASFMVRGAIDIVIQLMKLEVMRKEKGFADLVKGLIGVGAKTFDDGASMMVLLDQDASGF